MSIATGISPRRFLVGVGLALLLSTPATAGIIVDWHNDYVSGDQNLQGWNADSETVNLNNIDPLDSRTGRAFSTTVSMNPTSDYSGTSGTFYGGASAEQMDAISAGWDTFVVKNNGSNDHLRFKIQQGTELHTMHLVLYWDKVGFLDGYPSASVSLDPTSSFLIHIDNTNSSMGDGVARWLVRQGDVFYLSEQSFVPNNGDHTLTGFTALSNGNWAAYAPSGLAIDFNGTTFTDTKFTNISAVGVYIEHDMPRDNHELSIHQFQVNAVPEPATVVLLIIGAIALIWQRKYQR